MWLSIYQIFGAMQIEFYQRFASGHRQSLAVASRNRRAFKSELVALPTHFQREAPAIRARVRARDPGDLVAAAIIGVFAFPVDLVPRQKCLVRSVTKNEVTQEDRCVPNRSIGIDRILAITWRRCPWILGP